MAVEGGFWFKRGRHGFTLTEMLVVVLVVGIFVIAAAGAMGSASARLRGLVYRVLADLNLARSEAVNRNGGILCDFLMAGEVDDDGVAAVTDGYRLCVDIDGDNNCDGGDTMLREYFFPAGVVYYDLDLPARIGPDKKPDGSVWVPGGDGVSFSTNRMVMEPDGSSNKAGTAYVCAIAPTGGIAAGPAAVVVSRVGRIRLDWWQPEKGRWKGR